MSEAVVVVSPTGVCGPGTVDAELAAVALEYVDDRLAVWAGDVVAVRGLWCDVMSAALATAESALLVVPSWWPRARVELVEEALLAACRNVTVRQRGCAVLQDASAVVELGPDVVIVHACGEQRTVVPRTPGSPPVADAVLGALPAVANVVIDCPTGLPNTEQLVDELARRLYRRSVHVTRMNDAAVRCFVADAREVRHPATPVERSWRVDKARVAAVTGVLATIAVLVGAGMWSGAGGSVDSDVAWVLEWPVAVEVPAHWSVERVVDGPGSARVQVVSPHQPGLAIHLVQARVPEHETLQRTAEALRTALADQPDGLFTDFAPDDQGVGRPAVTYSEVRPAATVDWVVMVDRGVRIAVGCQRPQALAHGDPACERAVRSAHTLR